MKDDSAYYLNEDVIFIAKELIGNEIFTKINGKVTAGIITETEAYNGILDKASHSYNGKRTERNEVMYQKGGIIYVYLCYGIHFLLNIVTGPKDDPKAVLIRAIEPTKGIDTMLKRREKSNFKKNDHIGPGKVTKSLGINLSHNQLKVNCESIWLKENKIQSDQIKADKRIGIDYAQEDALLPYRFILN